ncbi:hypothetical protein [Castellaniella caeni]|uniref:hypothetical protein n=1 Tax=Castellaniella caeni TaxID=266123 RepID=UPI0011AF5D3D|nr:hypothetical protein [Castellaniella caeni]
MSIAQISYGLVAVLLASAGAGWLGYGRGYDQGELAQRSRTDAAQIRSLSGQLTTIAANAQAAADDSRTIRNTMTKIENAQAASTQELKDALKRNKTDPVLCRFDADSMRIIAAARAAAARAAAGGIDGALPATR